MFKYAKLENMAVVYACFVVRSRFLSEAEENLAYAGVLLSRALFCEILAMKLLGRFASNEIQLATALTASWNPLAGAPPDVEDDIRISVGDVDVDPQSALEVQMLVISATRDSNKITDGNCYGVKALHFFNSSPSGCRPYLQRTRGVLHNIKSFGTGGQLQAKRH